MRKQDEGTDLDTKGGKCFQDKDVISWVNVSDSFSLMTKKWSLGLVIWRPLMTLRRTVSVEL